jgi:hypothetical protein
MELLEELDAPIRRASSGKIIAWCINSTGSKQYSLIKGGRPIPPDPLEASDLA